LKGDFTDFKTAMSLGLSLFLFESNIFAS